MFALLIGSVISIVFMLFCGFVGLISSYWDLYFFLSGIIIYVRYSVISHRSANRHIMEGYIEKFDDSFSEEEKIFLVEASGIILPPKLLWAHFFQIEACSAAFWCDFLTIILFILSIYNGHYYVTCVTLLVFLTGYGCWLWQYCPFYSGFYEFDMSNAIALYYLNTKKKMTKDKEQLEAIIRIFMHTKNHFYYLLDEDNKKKHCAIN